MKRRADSTVVGAAWVAAACLVCAASAFGGSAGTVTLRAEVEAAMTVLKLADLAELSGEEAAALGGVEIAEFPAAQQQTVITMEQVRRRLDEREVHWGRLILRGATRIEVRRRSVPAAVIEQPGTTGGRDDAPAVLANPIHTVTTDGAAVADEVTVRELIVELVRRQVGAEGADLEIAFDDGAPADAAVLARTTAEGRFELEPQTSDFLGRVPIVVRRYVGRRLESTDRVTADVRVRRPAVVARRSIGRGQTITEADVTLRPVWLDSARGEPLVDLGAAVGHRAVGLAREGQVLRADDVQPPVVVRRRELLTVRCLSGNLMVKTIARALEEGAVGQVIEVRNDRTRETFRVRVTGPKEAVLIVGGAGSPGVETALAAGEEDRG